MVYRVSTTTKSGGAVSVIVDSIEAARLQVDEYRETGFENVAVSDMEGATVDLKSPDNRETG